jgi:type I restriction enzyme R subunit
VEDEEEVLSRLILRLNEKFGTDFAEADKVFLVDLEQRLAANDTIRRSVEVNTAENARLTFDSVARDELQQMVNTNFKFYKRINDDADFAHDLFKWLFERYLQSAA